MRDMLASHPDEPGHGGWYVVVDGRLIGICGFKGPPNQWGEAEIGYSVMRSYRRKGFATGAVGLLAARGFRDPRVAGVAAGTLPSLIASQTALIPRRLLAGQPPSR